MKYYHNGTAPSTAVGCASSFSAAPAPFPPLLQHYLGPMRGALEAHPISFCFGELVEFHLSPVCPQKFSERKSTHTFRCGPPPSIWRQQTKTPAPRVPSSFTELMSSSDNLWIGVRRHCIWFLSEGPNWPRGQAGVSEEAIGLGARQSGSEGPRLDQ